jgi:hypothetical protein
MSELRASTDKNRGKGAEDVRTRGDPDRNRGKGARMGGKKESLPVIEVH